ncbi:transposase, IS116/IS110/IS902 family [Leptospira kirschneri str. H2]|nr:transposase, IS116/IS110/IS902 family [Leptospira kirschneri str. H2]
MGDCKRFSSAKQAAYYVGLVPRVDISGDSAYYGRIVNRGCHSIRRVIVQAAWSLVRCQYGGKIKEFYQRLYPKKGEFDITRKGSMNELSTTLFTKAF